MLAVLSSFVLTGCGKEQLLHLKPVPAYWSAHSFASDEYSDQEVPVEQKEQLLRTCLQNKTVDLPKSYRTLETFGLFFTLNDLEIAPLPTEIVYLAKGKQMYVSCRSPKNQQLRVHPVKVSDHPWVRLTESPDRTALQAPVSIPLTEEQSDHHLAVNQEMSADNEFAKDLKPVHALQLPMAGQLLFVMTESGQEHIVRNIPLSSLHQQGEFYLVSRRHLDGSTSRSLTFSRDGWDMTDRHILTADKSARIKTQQYAFPKTLPVNQNVPFATLQVTKKGRITEEKMLSVRYRPVYRPVKEYQLEDEPRGITAYFHPTMKSFEQAKHSEMVILPERLSRAVAEELKTVTLEKPQGASSPFSYMTLLEYGNTQTFHVYLKKRANKTDLYLQDQRTKKSARLSGELARQISEELEAP